MNPLTEQMVQHDVDDTRALLDRAKQLTDADYTTAWFPGDSVLRWDGVDDSIQSVLEHLVWTKEVWVAAIEGNDIPPREGTAPADLIARHESVAVAWLGVVRDIDRRGAWEDRIIDALCEPPESFVLGERGRARADVLGAPAPAGAADAEDGRPRGRPRRPDRVAARAAGGGLMTRSVFYTATTLDGYIADENDSLDWLFKQEQDEAGPLNYNDFIKNVGAIAMGATTYLWVRDRLGTVAGLEDGWPYSQPSWVFTHRDLPGIEGADLRFVSGDVGSVWSDLAAAAGDRDVWVVGGGDLAAQFAEAGPPRRDHRLHRAGHPRRRPPDLPAPLRPPPRRARPEQGLHRRARTTSSARSPPDPGRP